MFNFRGFFKKLVVVAAVTLTVCWWFGITSIKNIILHPNNSTNTNNPSYEVRFDSKRDECEIQCNHPYCKDRKDSTKLLKNIEHLGTQTETNKQCDASTEPMYPVQQDNETQTATNQLCHNSTMTDNPICKDSATSMEKIENTSNATQTDTLPLATVETQTSSKTFCDIGIQTEAIVSIAVLNDFDKVNIEFVHKIIETLQINKYYEFFYSNLVSIFTFNSYKDNREKLSKIAEDAIISKNIMERIQKVKGSTADNNKNSEISSKVMKNLRNLIKIQHKSV